MKRRLIVPIDFGSASNAALRRAAAYSQRGGEDIVLVHVLPVISHGVIYGETLAISPALMIQLEDLQDSRALRKLKALLPAYELVPERVSIVLKRGEVAEQVLEVADRSDDFIILGANERHFVRGGLAEQLCRQAVCPLLACPSGDVPSEQRSRAVVAVDGSDISAAITRQAAELVGPDGELELVHVVDPRPVHHVATSIGGAPSNPDARVMAAIADAANNFESWVDGLHLSVRCTAVIANEPPANALLNRATADDLDFIAVGAHRQNSEQDGKDDHRSVIGLAEAILRHSPVPVLTLNR